MTSIPCFAGKVENGKTGHFFKMWVSQVACCQESRSYCGCSWHSPTMSKMILVRVNCSSGYMQRKPKRSNFLGHPVLGGFIWGSYFGGSYPSWKNFLAVAQFPKGKQALKQFIHVGRNPHHDELLLCFQTILNLFKSSKWGLHSVPSILWTESHCSFFFLDWEDVLHIFLLCNRFFFEVLHPKWHGSTIKLHAHNLFWFAQSSAFMLRSCERIGFQVSRNTIFNLANVFKKEGSLVDCKLLSSIGRWVTS